METQSLIKWTHTAQVLKRYGEQVRELYKMNLVRNGHPASGKLVQTAQYKVQMKERTFSVSMRLEEYWKWVENDTRPHFPPPDAIRRWIEIKPVIPHPDENGRLPTINQLTYLIGRKIANEGTTGTHDLELAVEEINKQMLESIDKAITEDISESVDIIIASYISK